MMSPSRISGRRLLAAGSGIAALAAAAALPHTARELAVATVALGALACVALRERSRRAATLRPVLVRLASCALSPGASLHAVRFEDRVLLVGATSGAITLIESTPSLEASGETDRDEPPAGRRPRRLVASAFLAVLALTCAGPAIGAQGDSKRQETRFDAPEAVATRDARSSAPAEVAPPGQALAVDPIALPAVGPDPTSGSLMWLAGLALAPFALMTMTSFVRISVVLSLVRSAIGTPQIPSDPVLAAIALALTCFVMAPVAAEAGRRVRESGADTTTAAGALAAASAASAPFRAFLQRNARPEEVALFVDLSHRSESAPAAAPDAFEVLVPAFITSELRAAFIAGFFIFVPFLAVDLIVSNILMSMGMVMVSPATVSLPFKVMLFVLVDGWPMLMKALALSYR